MSPEIHKFGSFESKIEVHKYIEGFHGILVKFVLVNRNLNTILSDCHSPTTQGGASRRGHFAVLRDRKKILAMTVFNVLLTNTEFSLN
jgi:hypothetical protein